MENNKKNNKKRNTVLVISLLLLLCIGIGTAALLGGRASGPNAPENIENNDTPLAAPSEAQEVVPSAEVPVAAAPEQSAQVAPSANAPANQGQLVAAPAPSAEEAPALPEASKEVEPSAPVESEEALPSPPAASEEALPSPPAASEEPAPSEPVEPEKPAPNKGSLGANWLYEQLFKEGSTIQKYFATRPSDAKVSLDSEGKNFAPTVNEEMAAEGLVGSWRIYANSVEKGEYNVFFTEANIAEMKKGDKIEEVTKISNYETPGEVVEQSGSATVVDRTVEGSTFNTINGGSFQADTEQVEIVT